MKQENMNTAVLIILSMLAGIGVMRTCDIIFGYRPMNSTCRIERLKQINNQLDELKSVYFDGDVKNGK